ncbi:MAG: aminoacyl-tRNA hydrolase, partial [Terrimicrobiaceae bacterium]|nr:aminoacyl-tRNA hydrolase [Terrimicrobiaceae bacterium]
SGTRHNIGFEIVGELARRCAATFSTDTRWNAEIAACGGRMLMRPLTFMNLSGEAVGRYARYHRLEPRQVMAILDDASLPLGTLRLRPSGGSGGHNGLESVLIHLGTEAVPRLRFGIGPPPPGLPLDQFVLSRFEPAEQEAVQEGILRAADAIEAACARGLDFAMTKFNTNEQ